MKYFFKHRISFEKIFQNGHIMLFLDYDGTLAPIVKRPQDAVMPSKIKRILKDLLKVPDIEIAVISGRRLDDVKKIVGLRNIIYVGNHGFEAEGPKIKFIVQNLSGFKAVLKKIKKELTKRLYGIKGILIEDKGVTLSVHYRLVRKKDISLIKAIFQKALIFYQIKNKVKTGFGKKLFEVRPAINWDKGKVVLWLLKRHKSFLKGKRVLPVYIGDDVTDEDAFKNLRGRGLTIFVGKSRSSQAEYFLKNTAQVHMFLKKILQLKRRSNICQS